MDVEIVKEHGNLLSYIDPGNHLSVALAQHLPPIVFCLVIAFVVRRQVGARWITSGAGLLLFSELFCLLANQGSVRSTLVELGPAIVVPLVYGSLILGFGFVGIGIMQPHKSMQKDESRLTRWLNVMLLLSVTIEVYLLLNQLSMVGGDLLIGSLQGTFHLVSLVLLIAVVLCRHLYHTQLSREAADGQRQLDAMISMFSTVKHDLNNDMQVVMGNAELADILIKAGGDVQKPVNNITNAANIAIERIDQLSVFNSTASPNLSAVDLNATLRESMARLVDEIPPIVTLKMELEYLPVRVMADRYMLSISLVNLIRQSLKNMQHGGEITIKTQDLRISGNRPGAAVVNAEVSIVRALGLPVGGNGRSESHDGRGKVNEELEAGISLTKSLVERSGAMGVSHSISPNEYLFTMGFASDAAAVSYSADLRYANEYSGCQHE